MPFTLTEPNPVTGIQRVALIEQALVAGSALAITSSYDAMAVDQTIARSRLVFSTMARVTTVSVAVTGAGAGSQTYGVVAVLGTGMTDVTTHALSGTGPTTLDSTHYNTITWTAVTGAYSYLIYRTVGGSSVGLIATVLASATLSVIDNGLVGDTTLPAALNSTGLVVQPTFTVYSGDGAITAFGTGAITKGSAAALTLGLPTAGAQSAGGHDGLSVRLFSTTAYQHAITTPAAGINGNKNTATLGGAVLDGVTFRAYNAKWYVEASTNVTLGGS